MSEVVKWPTSAGTRGVQLSEEPQRDPRTRKERQVLLCVCRPKPQRQSTWLYFAGFAQSPGAGRPGDLAALGPAAGSEQLLRTTFPRLLPTTFSPTPSLACFLFAQFWFSLQRVRIVLH